MKRMIVLLSGALALVSLASVSTAEAQSVERFRSSDTRVTGYLAVNVCCDLNVTDLDDDGIDVDYEADADPGIGFGLRAERRVADWLAIGGLFEFMAAKRDGADNRFFFIDADIFGKLLHEIELSGSMGLEVYALVPFGFTAGFADDDSLNPFFDADNARGFGLNTGLLGGAMLLIGKIGIVFEFGFRHRSVWDEVNSVDVRLGMSQVAMNFGASVAF